MCPPNLALRRRGPLFALIAVGIAYVIAQLLLVSHIGYGWDETVYLSQVSPDHPDAYWSPVRASGTSWLIAPVAAFTTALAPVRIYLTLLSGIGLALAYLPWTRLLGFVAPVAAFLLGSLWVGLFYGSAVMPNAFLAFTAVGAVGLFVACVTEGATRARLIALGGALAVAAMLRPTDAVFLVTPLTIAALVRWRRGRLIATLVAGATAGSIPWIVESFTRFGNPVARVQEGGSFLGGIGPTFAADLQLRAVNGPLLCLPCPRAEMPIPMSGVIWWSAASVLAGLGLALAWRRGWLPRLAVPALVAASASLPYLFLVGYAAPRFLLPSYALAAIPAAFALTRAAAARKRWTRSALIAALVGTMALHVVSQYRILTDVAGRAAARRDKIAIAAAGLREAGIRPPCVIAGVYSVQLAFHTGCDPARIGREEGALTPTELEALGEEFDIALVLRRRGDPPHWTRDWDRRRIEGIRGWVAYVPSDERAG